MLSVVIHFKVNRECRAKREGEWKEDESQKDNKQSKLFES
jgi:hypothetical protein